MPAITETTSLSGAAMSTAAQSCGRTERIMTSDTDASSALSLVNRHETGPGMAER